MSFGFSYEDVLRIARERGDDTLESEGGFLL